MFSVKSFVLRIREAKQVQNFLKDDGHSWMNPDKKDHKKKA